MSVSAEDQRQADGIARMMAAANVTVATPHKSTEQGCPSLPYDAPFDEESTLDALGRASEAMGASAECKTHAAAISDNKTASAKASMVIVTPYGGGGGTAESNSTETYTDNSLSAQGCGNISITSNAINNEQISMTCNMNSTLSEQSTTVNSGASLIINLDPPTGETLVAITTVATQLTAAITAAQQKVLDNANGPTAEISEIVLALARSGNTDGDFLRIATEALTEIHEKTVEILKTIVIMNKETLDNFNYNNPMISGVYGSKVHQSITSNVTVSSSQTIEDTHIEEMEKSITRMAKAVALDKIRTVMGAGAVGAGERTMINSQVDNAIRDSKKSIKETITKNKMTIENGNEIHFNLVGKIVDSEISQSLSSQVSLAVQQSVKKSVEIGSTVATKIITDTVTTRVEERTSEGMAEIVGAAGEANIGLVNATKATGMGGEFEGLGRGIGTVFEEAGDAFETATRGLGSMAMAAMMPLILVGVLVVGGLFIFPKLAPKLAAMSGASPGMIKIGGMILIACIIAAVIWFMVMPHFKKDKESRRRNNIVVPAPRQATPPVKTQPMKSPYMRVEPRNFKGERTAQKIPSYKKINQSYNFRPPTEKTHTNVYNPVKLSDNIRTVHNSSYHFQNKVDDKPVMYTKKSRV